MTSETLPFWCTWQFSTTIEIGSAISFRLSAYIRIPVAVVAFDKAIVECTIDQLFICSVELKVDASLRSRTFRLAKSEILDQQVIGCDDTNALAVVSVAGHILDVNVLTVRRTVFACAQRRFRCRYC